MTDPGLTAMLAVGLADYARHLIPLGPWGLKAVSAGSIMVLAGVHTLGISPGSRVMAALDRAQAGPAGVSRASGASEWAAATGRT